MGEWVIKILTVCVPVLVALVPIIPTIIQNGKKTQESIKESNDAVKKELAAVKSGFDAHVREYEDEKARNQRYRILRFYDELCEKRKHSESHFEDILDDIDNYEKYCEGHPQFKNSRGQVAMQYIKDMYGRVKCKGGFLTHDDDEKGGKENVSDE